METLATNRLSWLTRLRVQLLRRSKLLRVERFKLAFDDGDFDGANHHRHALYFYCKRIERLTGEPETLMRNS